MSSNEEFRNYDFDVLRGIVHRGALLRAERTREFSLMDYLSLEFVSSLLHPDRECLAQTSPAYHMSIIPTGDYHRPGAAQINSEFSATVAAGGTPP